MNEKIKYQKLLTDLNEIESNLLVSIQNLENAYNKAQESINIDNNCYKKRELEEILNNLKEKRNQLRNIYIPEVRKKIAEVK